MFGSYANILLHNPAPFTQASESHQAVKALSRQLRILVVTWNMANRLWSAEQLAKLLS